MLSERRYTGDRHYHILVREAAQGVLLAALVVAPMLDGAYPIFSYVDEVSAILLVIWGIFRQKKVSLGLNDRIVIAALAGVFALGLLGNVVWGYQSNHFAIAVDAFTCFKMFAAYYGAIQVVHDEQNIGRIASLICKVLVGAAAFGLLLHLTGIHQMGSDRQIFGVYCYQFLYGHTTELAAFCVGSAAVLMVDARKNKAWIVLALVLLLMTMRAKAVGIAFVIAFFFLRDLFLMGKKKVSLFLYLLIGVGVLLLGADQLQFYFEDSGSARYLMQVVSLEIASALFPLGAGFGTFASYMSGVYYSPLYYSFGLSTVWGLMPNDPAFVSDGFWPNVIGQFGFIGLGLFVVAIIFFFKSYISGCRAKGIEAGAYVIIPLYFLILSTSDAAFFNFFGVFYAMAMAIMASSGSNQESKLSSSGMKGVRQ